MPSQLTAYRVFIASPGGLEAERQKFRDTIQDYNNIDAIERGALFIPVGWEATLGGVGRPQKLINEDVRNCDYFVMLLWDRWGSPPQLGNRGPYTSGSEEEFHIAWESFERRRMRDLIIFFKSIEEQRLRDPGNQLERVLTFRQNLESEKKLLFETFDEISAFEKKLQQYFARWTRDHEKGMPDREHAGNTHLQRPLLPRASVSAQVPETTSSELVEGAGNLAKEGQLTRAERQLARAVVGEQQSDKQLDAANRYGALLLSMGKLLQAEEAFQRLHDLAQKHGNANWEIVSLNNLATVYIARDQPNDAEASYLRVVEIQEQTVGSYHPDVAVSLNNLGELYHRVGRYEEAESTFRRALEVQGLPNAS